jgi:DNA-binding HxlR family transcriptional regulator
MIERLASSDPTKITPTIPLLECPLKHGSTVLGKKWTPLILRDIGFRQIGRFSDLLVSVGGISRRVLSMRLRELEAKGLITRPTRGVSGKTMAWCLTDKGRDVLPILIQLASFGSKWNADTVFSDRRPRSLEEVFPQLNDNQITIRVRETSHVSSRDRI